MQSNEIVHDLVGIWGIACKYRRNVVGKGSASLTSKHTVNMYTDF